MRFCFQYWNDVEQIQSCSYTHHAFPNTEAMSAVYSYFAHHQIIPSETGYLIAMIDQNIGSIFYQSNDGSAPSMATPVLPVPDDLAYSCGQAMMCHQGCYFEHHNGKGMRDEHLPFEETGEHANLSYLAHHQRLLFSAQRNTISLLYIPLSGKASTVNADNPKPNSDSHVECYFAIPQWRRERILSILHLNGGFESMQQPRLLGWKGGTPLLVKSG